tara:strand:+ start:9680 stop:10207 length:528 start_codon:yes stop_codon:yes gene_type:complete
MSWVLRNETIDFLHHHFPNGAKILELGSGYGTNSLLDRGFDVSSIEQDPKWAFKYHENYILCPLKVSPKTEIFWFDADYLKGKLPLEYDILLIDGPTGQTEDYDDCRLGILEHLDLFNMNAYILVDDINRSYELELFHTLRKGKYSILASEARFGFIDKGNTPLDEFLKRFELES